VLACAFVDAFEEWAEVSFEGGVAVGASESFGLSELGEGHAAGRAGVWGWAEDGLGGPVGWGGWRVRQEAELAEQLGDRCGELSGLEEACGGGADFAEVSLDAEAAADLHFVHRRLALAAVALHG
jgi:hypothetical protein